MRAALLHRQECLCYQSVFYKMAPASAPRVPPAEVASEGKKPVLREELEAVLSSCDGIPKVRPRRLLSTPYTPERPCSAAIWRLKAVLSKLNWFCAAWLPSAMPFWRASSSVRSEKPAELFVAATRFCADCWSESKALANAPWDCPVTAAWSAGLRPGLARMLWNCEFRVLPVCCC